MGFLGKQCHFKYIKNFYAKQNRISEILPSDGFIHVLNTVEIINTGIWIERGKLTDEGNILQWFFFRCTYLTSLTNLWSLRQEMKCEGFPGSEWVRSLSCVRLFAIPWTVVYQASLSMGFSRQEYWSGFPLPFPEDLPDPGIEPRFSALQADALPSEPPGKPQSSASGKKKKNNKKKPACRWHKRHGFDPWIGKIPWRRAWQPSPVFLSGREHGLKSLAGYSP